MIQQRERIVFVSGNPHFDENAFKLYYITALEKALLQGVRKFVLCGEGKLSVSIQHFFIDTKKNIPELNILVVDARNKNNNLFPISFRHITKNWSFMERDEYITTNTTDDIVFIDNSPYSAGSAAAANLIRRQYGAEDTRKIQETIRGCFKIPLEKILCDNFNTYAAGIMHILGSSTVNFINDKKYLNNVTILKDDTFAM